MIKIRGYIHVVFCMLLCSVGFLISATGQNTQKNFLLQATTVDTGENSVKQLQLQQSFTTKTGCLQYVQQLPALLAAKGFITASVDSVKEDSSVVKIKVFIGEKYSWSNLSASFSTWEFLGTLGYKKETFNNKPFNPAKVEALYNQVLNHYQSTGYPFAKINLDSIQLNNGLVSAYLNIDKGFAYYIDSINLQGSTKISQDYIHRYLEIGHHELYNNDKLQKIDQRLAELPYMQQIQPWDITMLNTGAVLNLYLKPRQSNQIDVIVGFLPANEDNGGKLLLTGQADINLKNAFGSGEIIGVNWQQLQARSPRLNLIFQRPYMFHSPLGISFNFDLYKRDSAFLNINAQFGLQYSFSGKQTGMLFIQSTSTRLLTLDTNTVIATRRLPETSDISSVNIGLQYNFSNTNYTLNPRRGNEFFIKMSAGNKTVHKSTDILNIKDPAFNYAGLYDTVKLKSYQVRLQASGAHYQPLGKQAVVKMGANIGILQSPSYYVNELFQIGGYRLLRGFDEESIYTNRYAVGTLEYRYLIGINSYFFGFVDGGWAHYQTNALQFSHTYIGAGVGLAFETKTGIFNISYAAGKRNDTKLDMRQSKIHLGFVSLF